MGRCIIIPAENDGVLKNGQFIRIRSPEGMDLEQAERRPVRKDQPSDSRADTRQGIADRAVPPT
jgi:hypothetical protein